MASDPVQIPAHARQDPPWSDCGNPRHPDFGAVFAAPVADGALCFSFDHLGLRHALTLFDGAGVGAEIFIHGRRFTVVRQAVDVG